MWNLISCSKLTQERQTRRNHEMHRQKLRSMRAMMHIGQPEQPQFVYAKRKQEMSRRDRQIDIDKQNTLLLSRMSKVKASTRVNRSASARQLSTLHKSYRNGISDRIYRDNKRICDKLMAVASFYPTTSIMSQTDELVRIKANISENSRRVKSVQCQTARPITSISQGQQSRGSLHQLENTDRVTNSQTDVLNNNARPESAKYKQIRIKSRKDIDSTANKEQKGEKQIHGVKDDSLERTEQISVFSVSGTDMAVRN